MTRWSACPTALPPALAARLLSPALVIDLRAVRHNVATVVALCGGPDRWRPHVKTAKIPQVMRLLVDAGVRHFKTATTRETEVLCRVLDEAGARGADVLLAQPLREPALGRLHAIARAHPDVRVGVLCEDPDLAGALPAALGVFVDVDPGMGRTGVPLGDEDAIAAVARGAGDRLRGVHLYDGHRHEPDAARRERLAHADYAAAFALCARLAARGAPVAELVTSGTPAFRHALAFAGPRGAGAPVHRVSPGTVVYHDLRSAELDPGLDLQPAALVFTRVVSHAGERRVTCDAGSKSIAAEAGEPVAAVLGRPELVPGTPNEEHLPLTVTAGERPPRGTELLLVPRHVCPTINLAEQALLLDGERASVADVAARTHELLADTGWSATAPPP